MSVSSLSFFSGAFISSPRNQGQTTFFPALWENVVCPCLGWESFEGDLEVSQGIDPERAPRVNHHGCVRRLDNGGAPEGVSDRELFAVVDRGFSQAGPLDGARLENRPRRNALGRGFCLDELWPRGQCPRAQPAHHDLELRSGQRRAAAV